MIITKFKEEVKPTEQPTKQELTEAEKQEAIKYAKESGALPPNVKVEEVTRVRKEGKDTYEFKYKLFIPESIRPQVQAGKEFKSKYVGELKGFTYNPKVKAYVPYTTAVPITQYDLLLVASVAVPFISPVIGGLSTKTLVGGAVSSIAVGEAFSYVTTGKPMKYEQFVESALFGEAMPVFSGFFSDVGKPLVSGLYKKVVPSHARYILYQKAQALKMRTLIPFHRKVISPIQLRLEHIYHEAIYRTPKRLGTRFFGPQRYGEVKAVLRTPFGTYESFHYPFTTKVTPLSEYGGWLGMESKRRGIEAVMTWRIEPYPTTSLSTKLVAEGYKPPITEPYKLIRKGAFEFEQATKMKMPSGFYRATPPKVGESLWKPIRGIPSTPFDVTLQRAITKETGKRMGGLAFAQVSTKVSQEFPIQAPSPLTFQKALTRRYPTIKYKPLVGLGFRASQKQASKQATVLALSATQALKQKQKQAQKLAQVQALKLSRPLRQVAIAPPIIRPPRVPRTFRVPFVMPRFKTPRRKRKRKDLGVAWFKKVHPIKTHQEMNRLFFGSSKGKRKVAPQYPLKPSKVVTRGRKNKYAW